MILRLFQPPSKNWLLVAEQLDDPQMWNRFLPCHTATSQRWRFDCAAKELGAGKVKLKLCNDMLNRGISVFEYAWETDEDDILFHAMEVGEKLGVELLMDAPTATGASFRTVA